MDTSQARETIKGHCAKFKACKGCPLKTCTAPVSQGLAVDLQDGSNYSNWLISVAETIKLKSD